MAGRGAQREWEWEGRARWDSKNGISLPSKFELQENQNNGALPGSLLGTVPFLLERVSLPSWSHF